MSRLYKSRTILAAITLIGLLGMSAMSCASGGGGGNKLIQTTDNIVTTKPPPVSTTTAPPVSDKVSVSAVPSTQTIKAGDTFDVAIRVVNDKPARGLSFTLNWDASKISCSSATPGSYFQSFADANDGSLFVLPSNPTSDNAAGLFPKVVGTQNMVYLAMSGAMSPGGVSMGPTGSGDVYILHMVAKAGVTGTVTLTLSNVVLGSTADPPTNMNAKVVNGQITITS